MALYNSINFQPLDLQMGNSGGRVLKDYLSHRDNQRVREQNERAAFEASLMHLKRRQEMDNLAATLAPQQQPLQMGGLKAAPFNPSLDEYRKSQAELGRDKLELEAQKEKNRNAVAQRGMTVKEKLAMLKDMTDSEKIQKLQNGEITMQEIRDSEAMKRLEVEGQQRSSQIEQQNTGSMARTRENNTAAMNRVIQQGKNSYATATAPRPTSDSQQKVALQSRAVQYINRNPAMGQFIIWNDQGFPTISPNAPQELQVEMLQNIYGGSPQPDINLPYEGTSPSTSVTPNQYSGGAVTQPSVTQPAVTQPVATQPNAAPPLASSRGMVTKGNAPVKSTTPSPTAMPQGNMVRVVAPDGRTGTWDLSKGPVPLGFKKVE